MSKDCTIEDMTVDTSGRADVIEVESYDGDKKEFIAGSFGQPHVSALYCGGCGEYLFEAGQGFKSIDEYVRKHLEI